MTDKKSIKSVVNKSFDPISEKIDDILSETLLSNEIILYHGTTKENAEQIKKEGFIYGKNYNWEGAIQSKKDFIYLSTSYAPYYAMSAKSTSNNRAIIKVLVSKYDLYPDEDFITYIYKIPSEKINIEDYKELAFDSLNYLGNVAIRPDKIKIVGITYFDAKNLLMLCDPSITPINYKFMGNYYKGLTEWIYQGNIPLEYINKEPLDILKFIKTPRKDLILESIGK